MVVDVIEQDGHRFVHQFRWVMRFRPTDRKQEAINESSPRNYETEAEAARAAAKHITDNLYAINGTTSFSIEDCWVRVT